MPEPLPPVRLQVAMEQIAAWRRDTAARLDCPNCGAAGLVIDDRSARPYTEWYHLACAACGLDHTIAIPLAPPASH